MGLLSFIEDVYDFAKELIGKIAEFVKAVFIHLLSFSKHIVSWFKDPKRLSNLRKNKNIIAVTVKENLDNGNYNVVDCLFDKSTNDVIDISDSALYEAGDLDQETENAFGDKPMVVLQ